MGLYDGINVIPDAKCIFCDYDIYSLQTKAFTERCQRPFNYTDYLPIDEYEQDKEWRPSKTVGKAWENCKQCKAWLEYYFYMDNLGRILYMIPDVVQSRKDLQ